MEADSMVKLIEQPNKKEIECKYIHDNKKKAYIYIYSDSVGSKVLLNHNQM